MKIFQEMQYHSSCKCLRHSYLPLIFAFIPHKMHALRLRMIMRRFFCMKRENVCCFLHYFSLVSQNTFKNSQIKGQNAQNTKKAIKYSSSNLSQRKFKLFSWRKKRLIMRNIFCMNVVKMYVVLCNRILLPCRLFVQHHAELLHFCQNTETSGRRPHKIINDPSVHWLQVNVSC